MAVHRFLMLTTFYPPYHFGGDAMYVYRLSEALARAGHEVDVVHSVDAYRLQHPGEPEHAFEHHPRVRRFPLLSPHPQLAALAAHQLGRPALYAKRLRALLAERQPDVMHFQNVSLLGAPGLLALGRALKLYTANEYWLICPTHVLFRNDSEACTRRTCLSCTVRYYRRPPQLWRATGALRRALRHVDCVLFPSQFALEQHRAEGLERPLAHLPYLIPEPAAPSVDPEPRPGARPYFLIVGRLEKLKGVQEALELFAEYRAADLRIAGTGSQLENLRQQARGLTHVHFLGALHPDALAEQYRHALAVLVPSLCYETFGLTAAEAMSHGTPAVVRRIGALFENVEATGAGLSFSTRAEFQAALERLRTEPGLRDRLGARGREAAGRLWSAPAHLERYLGIVEALRAGQRPPELA